MAVTRRNFVRYGFIGSFGTLIPPILQHTYAMSTSLADDARLEIVIEKWAELAEWERIRAANPAPAMHNAIMRAMSRRYPKDYFIAHDKLPTGIHRVQYRCGRESDNEVLVSIGPSCIRRGTITYPIDYQRTIASAL